MTQANNVAIESSQINSSGVLLTPGGGTGLSTVGTNGQVLTSNGTTLSWVTPTTTSPGGSNTQVQFNNSGAFGGSANLTFDGSNINVGGYVLLTNNQYHGVKDTTGNAVGFPIFTGSNDAIFGYLAGGTTGISTYQFRSGNNVERMRIDSSGNVGIGTTTPGAPLSFADSLATKIQLNGNSANYYAIAKAASILSTDGMFKFVAGATSGGEFGFYSGSATTPAVLIGSNGVIYNSSSRPMLKQTGGILQVQQAVLPSLFTTSSTTMVDVTSLTLTITPSSSSSKFYIQVTLFGFPNTYTGFANIVRVVGGTPTNLLQATPAGVRPITSIAFSQDPSGNGPTNTLTQSVLDSPATASAITYKVQASSRPDGQGGAFLNIGASATDRNTNSYDPRGSSSITVWEIAG